MLSTARTILLFPDHFAEVVWTNGHFYLGGETFITSFSRICRTIVTPTIRLATPADAPASRAIYAPSVRDSAISFELTPPTVAETRSRIADTLETLPWLVAIHEGELVGYTYAHAYRRRPAYQWSAESSVYVDKAVHRSGVARGLYRSLFELLGHQGYRRLYAATTIPNEASVAFHESMGFEPIGVFENVGFKDGSWHDVMWLQRSLGDRPDDPDPPIDLPEARTQDGWRGALTSGESYIDL